MNGAPGLILDISRTITSDEVGETKIVRAQMAEIEKKYPQIEFHELFAPADYTQASLNGVLQSLLEGIFLTAIVLMLFLHAWRNAVVVMVAIPSSLLATFIVMRVMGLTLDNVSLMGLSLIIGILVDDSIVVLENITRHRDMGQAPTDAAHQRAQRDRRRGDRDHAGRRRRLPAAGVPERLRRPVHEGVRHRRHRRDAVLAVRLVHAHAGARGEVVGAASAVVAPPH